MGQKINITASVSVPTIYDHAINVIKLYDNSMPRLRFIFKYKCCHISNPAMELSSYAE
jgi:hypothetical protein